MSRAGELDRLVVKAAKALAADAPAATDLPAQSGLYTLAASGPEAVSMLGLKELQPEAPLPRRILYLGKAEGSLESRLISTHFATGESGHSTVRRTLGALLGCQATPRPSRIVNPSRKQLMTMTANYAFTEGDDSRLSAWMQANLEVRVFATSHAPLGVLERRVGAILRPPLDQERKPFWEPNPWRAPVATAREGIRDLLRAELGVVSDGSRSRFEPTTPRPA